MKIANCCHYNATTTSAACSRHRYLIQLGFQLRSFLQWALAAQQLRHSALALEIKKGVSPSCAMYTWNYNMCLCMDVILRCIELFVYYMCSRVHISAFVNARKYDQHTGYPWHHGDLPSFTLNSWSRTINYKGQRSIKGHKPQRRHSVHMNNDCWGPPTMIWMPCHLQLWTRQR